jgi:hypothetical protein
LACGIVTATKIVRVDAREGQNIRKELSCAHASELNLVAAVLRGEVRGTINGVGRRGFAWRGCGWQQSCCHNGPHRSKSKRKHQRC